MDAIAFALGVFLLVLAFWDLFEDGRRATPDTRSVPDRPLPHPDMRTVRPPGIGGLLLAIVLAGCGLGLGASVAIRAGDRSRGQTNTDGSRGVACYTSGTQGELVADPVGGVAIIGDQDGRMVVRGPAGFTGRRAGAEVAILDGSGNVVAKTGMSVYLEGGNEQGEFATCPTGIHPPR